jgi:hypothetical protein
MLATTEFAIICMTPVAVVVILAPAVPGSAVALAIASPPVFIVRHVQTPVVRKRRPFDGYADNIDRPGRFRAAGGSSA